MRSCDGAGEQHLRGFVVVPRVVVVERRVGRGTDPGGLVVASEGSHLGREERFKEPPRHVDVTDWYEGDSAHHHEGLSDRRVVHHVCSLQQVPHSVGVSRALDYCGSRSLSR